MYLLSTHYVAILTSLSLLCLYSTLNLGIKLPPGGNCQQWISLVASAVPICKLLYMYNLSENCYRSLVILLNIASSLIDVIHENLLKLNVRLQLVYAHHFVTTCISSAFGAVLHCIHR